MKRLAGALQFTLKGGLKMFTVRIDTQLKSSRWDSPNSKGLELEKDDSYVELVGVEGEIVYHIKHPVAIKIGYDRYIIVDAQDLDIALQSVIKSADSSKLHVYFSDSKEKSTNDLNIEGKEEIAQDPNDTPCSE